MCKIFLKIISKFSTKTIQQSLMKQIIIIILKFSKIIILTITITNLSQEKTISVLS